jgi:regulatory protein
VVLDRLRAGAGEKGVQVTLSNGSSFFVPADAVLSLGLLEGMEIGEELYYALEREAAYLAAWEKALDLLARRDHSRFELSRKLRQRDFPESVVERVLGKLEGLHYVDDKRFAQLWVDSRISKKPEGRAKLLSGLSSRGVDRIVAMEAVESCFSEEDEDMALERAAEKLASKSSANARSATASLIRKGFSGSKVFRIVEKFFGSGEGLH